MDTATKTVPTADQLAAFFTPWAEKFLSLPQVPMDTELTRVFMVCSLEEDNPEFPPKSITNGFAYRMGLARANAIGLTLSTGVLTVLSSLTDGPGAMVMYLYVLRHYQKQHKLEGITMDAFSRAFPIGHPSKEHLSQMWDEQKGYGLGYSVDNLLDMMGDTPE